MTNSAPNTKPTPAHDQRVNRWRVAAWTVAGSLLLIPLVGTMVSDEVNWTLSDFLIGAILIGGVGILIELVFRKTKSALYRWGAGVAVGTASLLTWINGAVGIIGSESNDANLLYVGVLAVGVLGTILARFRPLGMSRAMGATALAQVAVTIGALVAGLDGGLTWVITLNAAFVALWCSSAWLFFRASGRG